METTALGQRAERRCRTCGAKAIGAACAECGSAVAPRAEIGALAGDNNFGTVNNVYNMGPVTAQEPERVPRVAAPPPSPAPGPSTAVRRTNAVTYVLAAVVLAGMVMVLLAVLRV